MDGAFTNTAAGGRAAAAGEVLHGKSKEDQRAIIAAFDDLTIADDTEVPIVNSAGISAGGGTYEEGIRRELSGMTCAEIEQEAVLFARRYGGVANPTVEKGIEVLEDWLTGELSGWEEVEALMLLRGRENVTGADRKAIQLYRFGADQGGTEETPIFQLLEGEI